MTATPETIDHSTLTQLVHAGAISRAHIVGQKGGWAVVVSYGTTERALAAQRSRQVRLFRKFETLVGYLRDVGIAKFDVDAGDYSPDALKAAKRPDSAVTLRRAHEAATHDTWFRAQVAQAMEAAEQPGAVWHDHDAMFDELSARAKRRVQ